MFYLFVKFWPTRESFGMARGPRFWAPGVLEGILDPSKIIKHICVLPVPKRCLRFGRAHGPRWCSRWCQANYLKGNYLMYIVEVGLFFQARLAPETVVGGRPELFKR